MFEWEGECWLCLATSYLVMRSASSLRPDMARA